MMGLCCAIKGTANPARAIPAANPLMCFFAIEFPLLNFMNLDSGREQEFCPVSASLESPEARAQLLPVE